MDLDRRMRKVSRELGVDVRLSVKSSEEPVCFEVDDRQQSGDVFRQELGTESQWELNLSMIHEAVYHGRAKKKHSEQGGRCSRCGKDLGEKGECNHKVHRSHGRDDRLENLEIVCPPFSGGCDFHRKEHGG